MNPSIYSYFNTIAMSFTRKGNEFQKFAELYKTDTHPNKGTPASFNFINFDKFFGGPAVILPLVYIFNSPFNYKVLKTNSNLEY